MSSQWRRQRVDFARCAGDTTFTFRHLWAPIAPKQLCWPLILEGTPALVGGVLTYFFLPSRPQEAKFLTADEKEWIRVELRREELQKLEQHQYSAT